MDVATNGALLVASIIAGAGRCRRRRHRAQVVSCFEAKSVLLLRNQSPGWTFETASVPATEKGDKKMSADRLPRLQSLAALGLCSLLALTGARAEPPTPPPGE